MLGSLSRTGSFREDSPAGPTGGKAASPHRSEELCGARRRPEEYGASRAQQRMQEPAGGRPPLQAAPAATAKQPEPSGFNPPPRSATVELAPKEAGSKRERLLESSGGFPPLEAATPSGAEWSRQQLRALRPPTQSSLQRPLEAAPKEVGSKRERLLDCWSLQGASPESPRWRQTRQAAQS